MKTLTTLVGLLSAAGVAMVLRPVKTDQGFMLKSRATANTPG